MGIGPVAEEKLHRLGIETVGQFAALAESEAASILGAGIGPGLHRLARGIDDRPVAERAEAKQISAESTFAEDLRTLDQLRDAVGPITEAAHRRLLGDGRGARTVTVKLKRSDMSTLTRSATLPYATAEPATLTATALRLLLDPVQIGPIRLLGVGFSGLSDVQQESLFPDLDQADPDEHGGSDAPAPEPARTGWRIGDDVSHPEFGHGWCRAPPRRGDRPLRNPRHRAGYRPHPVRRRPGPTPRRPAGEPRLGPVSYPQRANVSRHIAPGGQRRHQQHPRLRQPQPLSHHRPASTSADPGP